MAQQAGSKKKAGEDILRKTSYVLSYDPATGDLIQVVETDVLTGKTRTSTLSYDAAGNLIGVDQDP